MAMQGYSRIQATPLFAIYYHTQDDPCGWGRSLYGSCLLNNKILIAKTFFFKVVMLIVHMRNLLMSYMKQFLSTGKVNVRYHRQTILIFHVRKSYYFHSFNNYFYLRQQSDFQLARQDRPFLLGTS